MLPDIKIYDYFSQHKPIPTVQSELVPLIRSLTISEKRYFHIFASKHTIGIRNNYQKLFEAIDALPRDQPYDEAAFKRSLRGKSWGQNLANEKNYLYQLLIQALRSFHAESHSETKLYNQLAEIRVLISKTLYTSAIRLIDKAMALAEETENLPVMITLHQYIIICRKHDTKANDHELVEAESKTEHELMRMLDAERKAVRLRNKTFLLYSANKLKDELRQIKEKIDTLKEQTAMLPKATFMTQTGILVSQALVAECEGNHREGMKYYEELMTCWEKSPLNHHEPSYFIRKILGNYLVCAFYSEQLDVFPPVLERLRLLSVSNQQEALDSFMQLGKLQMLYLLNVADKTESDAIVANIEKELKNFNGQVEDDWLMRFRLNCCILYIQKKEYAKLLDAVNMAYELIKRKETFREEMMNLKFYELIALYGLQRLDVLLYQLDNAERWLRSHAYLNDCTKQMLKSFRLLMNGEPPEKVSGQLTEVNCPQEFEMMRAIMLVWLKG